MNGTATICYIVFLIIAMIVSAGCTDTWEAQSERISTNVVQTAQPAAHSPLALSKTVTMPSPAGTGKPAPVSSTGIIKIDPVGDKNTGDKFILTGTTSLPGGTILLWEILPDTGSPPNGLGGDSTMAVGGNNLVTEGEGTSNRIAIAVDLDRLIPGKYAAIVGKAKEQEQNSLDWEIGNDYAYTSFSLK